MNSKKTFSFSLANSEAVIETCSEKQVLWKVESQSLNNVYEEDHF